MRDAAHAAITAADLSSPELVALAKRYYIDLSADGLRNSFTYVIDIDRADACDEPLALGSSKIGGPAHLPADIQWPTDAEYYLYAQLSVAEIKPLDVHDMLPATGTLYYFITEQSRGRLLYSRADATNLRVVRRPATMALPSYMRFLAETEHRLSFRPNWYFDQGTDTYAVPAMINAVPAALRAHLDAIAGNAHGEVCHSKAGDRLFGGEAPDWQSEGDFLREPLLAQFRAFDGNLFVAVDPNDLRAGYTADAQCTYRGT